ncbi:Ig-like domain-containing protein [Listeria grandensis]|uniref:Ig-like domain-containing protein n=1 Tax=Listeria grandensis TaxID=1494963 RepID=UPI00164EAC1C|nr:Ig-like domain-containing protein [Listeria grandensis]MBC6314805.1 hypothetical protein [Listeria grandensis]
MKTKNKAISLLVISGMAISIVGGPPELFSKTPLANIEATAAVQEAPKITSSVIEGMTSVSGTSSPGDLVMVTLSRPILPYLTIKVIANSSGKWVCDVPPLVAGQSVQVHVQTAHGNFIGEGKNINLVTPTNLSRVTTKSTKITGRATPGNVVRTMGDVGFNRTATVAADGTFEIEIPPLDFNTWIGVMQEKEVAPNRFLFSEAAGAVVDQEDPEITSSIMAGDTKVSGTASPGAKITLHLAGHEIAKVYAHWMTGRWSADIPLSGGLAVGDILRVNAELDSNLKSNSYTTKMPKPSASMVTINTTKVLGKGLPGSIVDIKVNGHIIGNGQVKTDGYFEISIPKQAAGSSLSITQSKTGQTSEAIVVTVAKNLDKVSNLNGLTTIDTKVTGKGVPGAMVHVKVNGKEIGNSLVTIDDNFEVTIPKQAEGSQLSIYQTKDGDESPATVVTVQKGFAKPVINDFYYTHSDKVRGTVPAGTKTLHLLINGKFVREFTFDHFSTDGSDQPFEFDVKGIADFQVVGTYFSVFASDKDGQLGSVSGSFVKELLPPSVATYRAGQTYVSGFVGDNVARVAVFTKAGALVRYGQIDDDSMFRIYVNGQFPLVGDSFHVRAYDESGTIYSDKLVTVK